MLRDRFNVDPFNGLLVYNTTKQDRELMERRFIHQYNENKLNDNTKNPEEKSNKAGVIGEIAAEYYLRLFFNPSKIEAIGRKKLPYDFIITPQTGINTIWKVEAKCKGRTYPPRLTFDASTFLYQSSNAEIDPPTHYLFLSTIGDFSKVWFCAMCTPEEFWKDEEHGKLWLKGEIDPSNQMAYRGDTWVIQYKYLPRVKVPSFLTKQTGKSILPPQQNKQLAVSEHVQ